ncbi:UNVERIFIED_CONTAM: protein IQ-DOMAIN 20 [Sesamum radiatum]|uniref:Protein IQ-DOMAIN 20 n=1 Tax=Sesamum radiatum TaxID=300843 RepID=A0AAW2RGH3_SESRA
MIRRKLMFRSSASSHHHDVANSNIIVLHTNNGNFSQASNSSAACQENAGSDFMMSRDDIAAITIQACFRAHLARRAYRALRSLVKLQAVVRGVVVRRQARFALHCMHALARLQVTVRARQLLLNN